MRWLDVRKARYMGYIFMKSAFNQVIFGWDNRNVGTYLKKLHSIGIWARKAKWWTDVFLNATKCEGMSDSNLTKVPKGSFCAVCSWYMKEVFHSTCVVLTFPSKNTLQAYPGIASTSWDVHCLLPWSDFKCCTLARWGVSLNRPAVPTTRVCTVFLGSRYEIVRSFVCFYALQIQ